MLIARYTQGMGTGAPPTPSARRSWWTLRRRCRPLHGDRTVGASEQSTGGAICARHLPPMSILPRFSLNRLPSRIVRQAPARALLDLLDGADDFHLRQRDHDRGVAVAHVPVDPVGRQLGLHGGRLRPALSPLRPPGRGLGRPRRPPPRDDRRGPGARAGHRHLACGGHSRVAVRLVDLRRRLPLVDPDDLFRRRQLRRSARARRRGGTRAGEWAHPGQLRRRAGGWPVLCGRAPRRAHPAQLLWFDAASFSSRSGPCW